MKEIKVTIVLGSPASNCAKYGVCSIDESISDQEWDRFMPQHHRHVKAIISSENSGKVHLCFPTAVMLSVTAVMFFSKKGFLVESSCALPERICKQLNLENGSHLAPGMYSVTETPDAYTVEITVEVLATESFTDAGAHFNC